ncbi:MAG: tyrosine-type recombinase/integrase [Planctomycetota bacterium]
MVLKASALVLFAFASGWAKVKTVMDRADIVGPKACPKGLRHGFAVAALMSGVLITLVSKWLGHSSLRTTAIYTEVMGAEERKFAETFWRS